MSTETKTYNGWTNYETWNVALWIDNDQGSEQYWNERAQETWNDAEAGDVLNREEEASRTLADDLKNHFEEAWQEIVEAAGKHVHISCSVWADLMGAALSEVNWDEIAEHMIAEVDKD